MKARDAILSLAALLWLATSAAARLADHPGFKDPALFSRMPNFFLSDDSSFTDVPFDAHEFSIKVGDNLENRRVEGRYQIYTYQFDESRGAPHPSPLQIIRNYQNASRKAGGEILYDDNRYLTIRFTRNGQETWVGVDAVDGTAIRLDVVEKQDMQQDITAHTEGLQSGLAQKGHVEVPGILFDFGKSEVKPESEPALKEIVTLLQGDPKLKIWIVGHTDAVGSAESNVTLSNARAAAVVKVLTQKMGIDQKRLAPFGAGPYAPVASNTSDNGRAQNRRVELVAQP